MRTVQNQQGYAMIEVLVTLTILGIGMLCFSAVSGSVIKGNVSNSNMSTAMSLAQEQIESVKNLGATAASATIQASENYGTIESFPSFRRVSTLSTGTPSANTSTLTVTVFWNNNDHSVSFQTILVQ